MGYIDDSILSVLAAAEVTGKLDIATVPAIREIYSQLDSKQVRICDAIIIVTQRLCNWVISKHLQTSPGRSRSGHPIPTADAIAKNKSPEVSLPRASWVPPGCFLGAS